jgi:hypothetical protein
MWKKKMIETTNKKDIRKQQIYPFAPSRDATGGNSVTRHILLIVCLAATGVIMEPIF